MKFSEAFKLMKQGAKVKLPGWGGSQADMLAEDWIFAE